MTPEVNLPPVANNGNNIRLLTPQRELEEKNIKIFIYVTSTYFPKMSKLNNENFSD
jgi:hypothetical protein